MMLWNIIYDFFVSLFGGNYSDGSYASGFIGTLFSPNNPSANGGTDLICFKIGSIYNDDIGAYGDFYLSLGDWLATTFTVITLILICYVFLKITVWLFKWGAGLFKW